MKILSLLSSHERKLAFILLLMILAMAIVDMIGVASILPFITVLTNPELIESNIILNSMFKFFMRFGIENDQQFLFALGLIVFIILVTSLIFKAVTTYFQFRFAQMREYTIGKRIIEGSLRQPYVWFLNRNSSDLSKTILSEVGNVISNGLRPLIDLIASSMVAIAIILLLLFIDPQLMLIVCCSLGLAYSLIYLFTRKFLKKIGKERLKNNQLRYTAVSEAFGAAKEVKVGGLEKNYIKRFSLSASTYARHHSSAMTIEHVPRYILEAIAFGGIMLVILYLMRQTGSFNNALPIVSLYVFAGYRLMPTLQLIYRSISLITFSGPSVDALIKHLNEFKKEEIYQANKSLKLDKRIELKNIQFSYPNTSRKALNNINFCIEAKTTVGIIGTTGSGKTTLVDIILGLLHAEEGLLEVDGKLITKKNLRSWQRSIGYVPQHIYLSDDTVLANIAFGEEQKDINIESAIKASKLANLHSFVEEQLPNKYQTTVGERGVRLSGGERQRIGIARALYRKPKLLIFDEATSALDNQTESAIMDAVNILSKDITIILIAHRLTTLSKCDNIIKLRRGEIIDQGKFVEMIDTNGSVAKEKLKI